MIRVVADTNVLVSAIGWRGTPAQVLEAARARRLDIVLSPALLDELERVLAYPKLAGIIGDAAARVQELMEVASLVVPSATITAVIADDADNRVLEAAVAGRVSAVVSGDRHLLDLGVYDGIPILDPAAFVDRFLTGE